jgi:hypothetical protein
LLREGSKSFRGERGRFGNAGKTTSLQIMRNRLKRRKTNLLPDSTVG